MLIHAARPLFAWSDQAGDPDAAIVEGGEGEKGRAAVERVKIFWGMEDGTVVGARRFHAHVGVVLVVHLALAVWLAEQPRWEGAAPDSLPDQDVASDAA